MAARTKARKRALDLLFEAEQRGLDARQLLTERMEQPVTQHPLADFTVELVAGVIDHRSEIDEIIQTYAQGWRLDRLPAVDRTILRLGIFEVVWSQEVPDPVAISEWVALATELSTDDSPKFVNGILARVSQLKSTLL